MDSSIVPEEFLAHIGTDDVETRAANKSLPSDGRIMSVAVISAKVSKCGREYMRSPSSPRRINGLRTGPYLQICLIV